MRPYSEINIGDIYQRRAGSLSWVVISKNDDSKQIEIRSEYQHPLLEPSLWKKATDSIFTRRIIEGTKIGPSEPPIDWQARALKAEAERDALDQYAQHQTGCKYFSGLDGHGRDLPCTCGLDALRAEIGNGK
jgi:hypothetical protein